MTELDAAEKVADGDTVRDTVVSPTSTSSPDAPRWRCVASSADLRAVASARVRFTCVDATPALVVLGANTGSAYIFSRTRGPTDARGSSRSAPERRLRFVAVVSPELLGRGTGDRARAAPQSVRVIKASPCGRMCAIGFADGNVRVIELDEVTRDETRRRSAMGATVAFLSTSHGGRPITAMVWSVNSKTLYAGSDKGRVTLVSCEEFVRWCDEGRMGPKPAVVNKTEYTDADSGVHQLDSSKSDSNLLMSAQSSVKLVPVDGENCGVVTNVGSKQREGAYGSCFHDYAALSIDEDQLVDEEDVWDDDAVKRIIEYAVVARPGRKFWIAKFDNYEEEAQVEIMATIKPEVPEPSPVPGWNRENESVESMKKLSKRFEFGLMRRLGPCVLSTTDRSVAVVDVASPAIARWYPLREPGNDDIGAGFVDVCVFDHRAFFLTPSEEGGGSIWCLESFIDAPSLARDVVHESRDVSSMIRALQICQKTSTFDETLFNKAKETLESSEGADKGSMQTLASLIEWGEQNGTALMVEERDEDDDPRELVSGEVASPTKPNPSESGKPPLGKDRSSRETTVVEEGVLLSTSEFPKAETDGGIFFYNPRGMSKSVKASEDVGKTHSGKVKKRRALILDDVVGDDVPALTPMSPPPKASPVVKKKNYAVDYPTNDAEWEECDEFDADEWRAAISTAEDTLPSEGEAFEHWDSYDAMKTTSNATPGRIFGETVRLKCRAATKARVAVAVECVAPLKESRISMDASKLIPALRRWRDMKMELNKLFDEHKEGEHAAIVAKTKLQIESLLRRIEDALETASDELRLDVNASSCTHSPVKNARESDQQSPVKERVATDVLPFEDVEKILMDERVADVGASVESDCVASLRSAETHQTASMITRCLRRALHDFTRTFETDASAVDRCESRLKCISRVYSAARGPAEAAWRLLDASEDDSLSRVMSPTHANEPASAAMSRILTVIVSYLTSENSIDLDVRRSAARLLEPLHLHLSEPPMRAFGRFPELQVALRAELTGDTDRVPFIQRISNDDDDDDDDNAPSSSLVVSRARPADASVEDFGDWGVRMDLRRCPACRRSLLRDNAGPLITFTCAHTYHKACCFPSMACFACHETP